MIRWVLAFAAMIGLAAPAMAAVDIQEIETPGGYKAWLVEEHSIPFTALEIRFSGGTSLDRPGKRGAVNLMTGLLEEGAGDLDAQGFATARDTLAAKFRYSSSLDAVSVSAQFLTENRDQAIALLRSSLIAPSFGDQAVERVRAQVLSGIRSDMTDPDTIAQHAAAELRFGDHPYGSSQDGTMESVTALTRDDLVQAHRDTMARDRVYIGAVGDITAEELSELIDTLLADLPETGAPLPERAELLSGGGVTVIPFDTPQSVALFGHAGIPREDPDFFAAYLLNHILGGGSFTSRLMEEVREKRGLTYGISTFLVNWDLAEVYLGQLASANETMAEAIGVIRDEWQRLAVEGVTAEELQDAKTFVTGAYPLRFDGNRSIAGILVGMQSIGLTPDYIATRNDRMNAVTLEDMQRVARRLIDPEGLHFVVVGRPVGLESTE